MRESIHDKAAGKWRAILPELGVDGRFLTGKHGACPMCGGKDRWRFDDKDGRGTFYCSGCGPGTGVDLVMRLHSVDFVGAVKMIEPYLPAAPIIVQKAQDKPRLDGHSIWARGLPVRPGDVVSKYLESRGLEFDSVPSQIRIMERALYVHDDKRRENFPAMIAKFVSPCRSVTTVHFTFLDADGRKAGVPSVRKFYPGKIPEGGAVRLAPSADTMGVAEGLETAMSAMQLFEIPVWATLTAIGLTKWEPPPTARNIIVFGDADAKYAGQHAAYALAYRLATKGINVEVRIPDELGNDWNDMLMSERR